MAILGVLIVVGLIAGAVFMWRNHGFRMLARGMMCRGTSSGPTPPACARRAAAGTRITDAITWTEWGGGMPMMGRGYGYSPRAFGPMGTGFMLVGGLFHLLLPLGLLALVAYVFYQMGKRAGAASRPAPMPDADSLPRRKVARS